jgi:cell wall-associated NlpC family hydrolase
MDLRVQRFIALAALGSTVWLGGCASHARPEVLPPTGRAGQAVVRTAEALVGTPYRLGGEDPTGFDCSGLVRYVLRQHGLDVPRNVASQWRTGRDIDRSDIRAGDLLFFATKGPGPTHVSLALDRQRFVHAPNARGVVRIESLTSSYWSQRFLGARRLLY